MRRTRSVTLALAGVATAVTFLTGAPVRAQAEAAAAAARPAIHHVWLIVLENEGYQSTYVSNPNTYLSATLVHRGALLSEYYATGHVSNDNYISMISGQAPNPENQSDCQDYVDLRPGTLGPNGQAIGQGCVFPATVLTLADQLSAAGLTWKAYMEDMGNDPAREPDRCGDPGNPSGVGSRDGTQSAEAIDQYAARHNPFVYFHSILGSGRCQTNVVPLNQLAGDLAHLSTSPVFSFLTPNLCNDGHDNPCTGTNVRGTHVGGLAAADYWLQKYIPLVTHSAAYHDGGLIIITTDEASTSDARACCNEQAGLNSPQPGITGPGGGQVGAVVLGTCVRPGTKDANPYNHYALLRSLEDIFGIRTGGSDGKGHLGYAGGATLKSFGTDVFNGCAVAPPAGIASHPPAATPSLARTVMGGGPSLPRTGGLPWAAAGAGLLLAVLVLQRFHGGLNR